MINEQLMVSVVMITYGHEIYIKQAIEGVLMQQCDFEVELIIANDCSPDSTDEVVKDIIVHHPKSSWITYTRHRTNKGIMPNFIWALEQCQGKYIALCEGDDYWTDPLKLQKQVDFLEENDDFIGCFHNVYTSRATDMQLFNKYYDKDIYTLEDLLSSWIIPTCSVVFRNNHLIFPDWVNNVPNGDLCLFLNLAKEGSFKLIDGVMGVYRLHANGITAQLNKSRTLLNVFYIFKNLDIDTDGKYHNAILASIDKFVGDNYKRTIIRDYLQGPDKLAVLNQSFSYKELLKVFWLKFKNNLKIN